MLEFGKCSHWRIYPLSMVDIKKMICRNMKARLVLYCKMMRNQQYSILLWKVYSHHIKILCHQ